MAAIALSAATGPARATRSAPRFMVQAATVEDARVDVASVGAPVEHDLGIINAVSAHLDSSQAARLRSMPGVHVFADRALMASASPAAAGAGASSAISSSLGCDDHRGQSDPGGLHGHQCNRYEGQRRYGAAGRHLGEYADPTL